mmetsp:Transcript_62385/g.197640  ORF Transcript_62385/g.197640 Transcript_62385/m.197640 type:complete len:232 (-) Transcript_62385:1068-1763(-)
MSSSRRPCLDRRPGRPRPGQPGRRRRHEGELSWMEQGPGPSEGPRGLGRAHPPPATLGRHLLPHPRPRHGFPGGEAFHWRKRSKPQYKSSTKPEIFQGLAASLPTRRPLRCCSRLVRGAESSARGDGLPDLTAPRGLPSGAGPVGASPASPGHCCTHRTTNKNHTTTCQIRIAVPGRPCGICPRAARPRRRAASGGSPAVMRARGCPFGWAAPPRLSASRPISRTRTDSEG